MAAHSLLAFLAPHLNYPASALVVGHEEVVVALQGIAEVVIHGTEIRFVLGILVYLGQSVIVGLAVGKASAQVLKRDVVYLAQATAIPTSKVPHVVVDEEIVGLHIVRPTVQLVFSPTVPLPLYHKSRYEELFHAPRVYLGHAVQLHVALQHGTHGFAIPLLVSVSCRAGRLFGLAAVHAKHGLHHASDEVVLQRHVALFLDEFLFLHHLAVHAYIVIPLPTVGVVLVSLTVSAECLHRKPILLCLPQHLKGTVIAHRAPCMAHAVQFLLRHHTAHSM